jgi:predicted secreted protein with PEFG-CTERM motif
LLSVLAAVSVLSISSANAQTCVGCEDGIMVTNQMLPTDVPIAIWTDKTTYDHNDAVTVYGRVANVSGYPVTLTVVNPMYSVVSIAQLDVAKDGSFGTTLSTAGEGWKQNGTYTVKVNYGTATKSNKAFIELTGEILNDANCGSSEISVEDKCVPYSISSGKVLGADVNNKNKSLIIRISSDEDGIFTLSPAKSVLDGMFMVLVDGQEWSDVEFDDGKVTVMFPAGTETIEVIGTFVIPEFGTIAVMILAVAIISIIAISARSRLSIMPRY